MRSSTSNLGKLILALAAVAILRTTAAADLPAAQLFQTGLDALRSADYSGAEQSFLQVLKQEPDNLGALGNLGVIYARTNRPARAIATYERALRLAPHDEGLLLNLGLAYVKNQEYAAALPKFVEVEALDSDSLQAQELAATCRIYTGHIEEAIKNLRDLRAKDPNKAAVLYLLGVAYTRAKQPELAKPVFAELLSSSVNPAQANFLLGRAYYEGGQFANAEKCYRDVLALEPAFPGARLQLAKVLISERENADALNQLRDILQRNSSDQDAQYYLGALDVQLGKYADALPHLQKAELSFPDSWALNFYLGKAALRTNQVQVAIRRLSTAAELNHDDASTLYLLSQAYRTAGENSKADSILQQLKSVQAKSLEKEEAAVGHIPAP